MIENSRMSDKSKQLYDELQNKIEEYFQSIWQDVEASVEGEYLENWVIVVNYGNVNNGGPATGYAYETFPYRTAPHAAKGLLREGIIAVEDSQIDDDMPSES